MGGSTASGCSCYNALLIGRIVINTSMTTAFKQSLPFRPKGDAVGCSDLTVPICRLVVQFEVFGHPSVNQYHRWTARASLILEWDGRLVLHVILFPPTTIVSPPRRRRSRPPDADDGEDTQAPEEASSYGKYVAVTASGTPIAKQSNIPADPDTRPARPRTRQTNPKVCVLRISSPSNPSTVPMRANWSVGGDRA